MNKDTSYSSLEMLEIFLHIRNRQQIENRGSDKHISEKSADVYYDYAVNYIKSNLFRPIFVNEITHKLGITQPYLYKIFMSKSGISPKQYISLSKITEAKRLLVSTSLNTSEIANSVGYKNVLDFYKFFKRETGYTPTQYKKS